MKYILFLIISTGWGGPDIRVAEFNGPQACKDAVVQLKAKVRGVSIDYLCVEKGAE